MATVTASSFSCLLLLAAISILLPPSSANHEPGHFHNCTEDQNPPYTVLILQLETYPAATANTNLTVYIKAYTDDHYPIVPYPAGVFVVYKLYDLVVGLVPLFQTEKLMCGGPSGFACPAPPSVFEEYHTFRLPLTTTIIPGNYTLQVSIENRSIITQTLACIHSDLTVA